MKFRDDEEIVKPFSIVNLKEALRLGCRCVCEGSEDGSRHELWSGHLIFDRLRAIVNGYGEQIA